MSHVGGMLRVTLEECYCQIEKCNFWEEDNIIGFIGRMLLPDDMNEIARQEE